MSSPIIVTYVWQARAYDAKRNWEHKFDMSMSHKNVTNKQLDKK